MSRFAVGDVVVLNGHRLTVETVPNAEWVEVLDPDHEGEPSRYDIPARFLPDAEPRESREVAAARAALAEALAVLDRYEQEHGQLQDGWQCLGPAAAVLRERLASLPTPAASSGPAAVPAPVTYDDSEGDLERLARDAAALTPGQPVAHRDGRLGLYVGRGMGSTQGLDLIWQAHGSNAREYTVASDLRPVSLVEKPDSERVAALLSPVLQGSGDARRRNVDRIYRALFGPGEPS